MVACGRAGGREGGREGREGARGRDTVSCAGRKERKDAAGSGYGEGAFLFLSFFFWI